MPLDLTSTAEHSLPEDWRDAALAGRVWRPELGGPSVVAIRADGVVDITRELRDDARSVRG